MRHNLCTSCLRALRQAPKANLRERRGLQNSDRIQRRFKSYIAPPGGQAHSLEGYYADMLKNPQSQFQAMSQSDPIPPVPPLPAETPKKTQKEETFAKAAIIFGSKTALAERRQEILNASQVIAGITVPPKPEEPDNCCMSGCVNCVWEMYRDEMEEWAEKSAQARAAMAAQREKGKGTGSMVAGSGTPDHVAVSMDDDGGGSETNWDLDDGTKAENLFDDIPVGIREFMRTEKKLRQMHTKDEAASA